MKMVSLLRGINVGGHKKIRMADLRSLYEDLGHGQVASYIQSGNVVFETSDRSRDRVRRGIQDAIADRFGFDVPVELRSHRELDAILKNSPFGKVDLATEGALIGVAFLAARPADARIADLYQIVRAPEEVAVVGKDVYLRYPHGFGRAKLTHTHIESKLGTAATTRNWKTVQKLWELSA